MLRSRLLVSSAAPALCAGLGFLLVRAVDKPAASIAERQGQALWGFRFGLYASPPPSY